MSYTPPYDWDEPVYDDVNDEARAAWVRERPDDDHPGPEVDLPQWAQQRPVCDPATCQHYEPCPPDPWEPIYRNERIA